MIAPLLAGYTWAVGDYEVSLLPYLAILTVGLLALIPFTLFRKWYFYRRRIKANIITVEYEPPAGLRPAEVQYLFGGINQERIVAATIIHMVQAGYIHARKVDDKKRLFAGPKEPNEQELRLYEQMILSAAGKKNGADPVVLMEQPINFVDGGLGQPKSNATTLSEYIHEALQQKNLVKGRGVNQFFIDGVKVAILLIVSLVWWPLLLFLFMSVVSSSSTELSPLLDFLQLGFVLTAFIAVPILVLSVFIVKWRAQLLGRRWMSSPRLNRLWPQIVGFRHFVKLTEKNRLKFDSDELQKASSKDVLPYAVALGFVKNWREIVS